MRLISRFLVFCVLAGLAVAQTPAGKTAGSQSSPDVPKYVPSFDEKSLDKTADPCFDFYQYSCGGWIKNNPIPADQPAWGRFNELAERNRVILHNILEDAAKATNRDANGQKIGDFYASCMDEEAINKKGVTVLKPEFDRIAAVKDKAELPAIVGYLHDHGVSAFFGFSSGPDFKNAKEVIAQADQGGLSLPDRDYYMKDDAKSVELRKAYLQHVTNMFKLLGDAPDKAAAEAKTVMDVETALAKGAMDRVERRVAGAGAILPGRKLCNRLGDTEIFRTERRQS